MAKCRGKGHRLGESKGGTRGRVAGARRDCTAGGYHKKINKIKIVEWRLLAYCAYSEVATFHRHDTLQSLSYFFFPLRLRLRLRLTSLAPVPPFRMASRIPASQRKGGALQNYAAIPQSPQTAHYLHHQQQQQQQQPFQLKPYTSARSRTHSAGSSAEMPLNPTRPNENTSRGVLTGHIGGGFGPYAVCYYCSYYYHYYYLLLPLANPFFSSSRPKSPRNLLPAHASLSSPTQKNHSALPSRQTRSAHPRTSGILVTQTSTMLSTAPTLAKTLSRTLSGLSGALAAGQTISLSSQSSSALSPSSLPIPSSHTIR